MAGERIHICSDCGKTATKSTIDSLFYVSYSKYFGNLNKTPLCKECILKHSINPDKSFSLIKFKDVLKIIDKPFLYQIYDTSIIKATNKDTNEIDYTSAFSQYMKNIVMPQYKNMTSLDSDIDNEVMHSEEEENEQNGMFWGFGFEQFEYNYLNNKYGEYVNMYECDTPAMEELLKQAAFESLEIRQKREKKNDVSKNLRNLQDLLGTANIKPVQETGANATDQATFGVLIKKYENERPIPEPDEEWKDVDGIGKYISVWFLGHLCKMLGISNEYSLMYEEEMQKYRVTSPENDEVPVDEMEDEVGDI